MNPKFGRLRSDYDPKTVLAISETEDSDICVKVFGNGEFKIAGINGGSHIQSEKKCRLINLFSEIIDVLDGIDFKNSYWE